MRVLISFIFALTSSLTSAAWVIHNISTDRELFFYYDSDSIERLDDVIKVQELVNYPNTTEQPRSAILTNYYDCQSRTKKSYQIENYSGFMANGDRISQEIDADASWEIITNATSISGNILNILCGFIDYRKAFVDSFVKTCEDTQKAGVASTGFEVTEEVIGRYCVCVADYIYSATGENVIREVELGTRQISVLTALNNPAANYCTNQVIK